MADDVVVYPIEGWPDQPVYHGHEGARKVFAVWWEFFDSTHFAIEQLIEDGDFVITLGLQTGSQQGVTVEQRVGSVSEFRDDLAVRVDFFLSWEKALAFAEERKRERRET